MNADYFGEEVAARYDEGAGDMPVDIVVDFLASLAGDGRALEFGIGTGRIGLPLHERGTPVDGIDLSSAMLALLKAKPGSEHTHTVEGDLAAQDFTSHHMHIRDG